MALAEAGRRLATVGTLDELAPTAAELALDVLAASSASIGMLEREHGILRVLCNVGELADWEEERPTDEIYPVADFPQLVAAAEDARPWFGNLGDPEVGPAHHDLLERMGMQASSSFPIMVGTTIWGQFGGARRGHLPPFSPADVAAGEAFAGMLGAAISRIQDRDELQVMAYRDPLTGLGNRRAVDDRLEAFFHAPGGDGSVGAVICDVNGLRAINERFGHDAGDRLLREVASALSTVAGTLPDSLAARLGGDEFCLLLMGASEAAVRDASERIAIAAEGLPMGAELTCGWARATERPGDAPTATVAARALLRLADAAQFRAKRTSRRSSTVPVVPAPNDPTQQHPALVEAAIAQLRTAGGDVAERLRVVATVVGHHVQAGGWAVSRRIGNGLLESISHDAERGVGLAPAAVAVQGVQVDPERYPATLRALEGGTLQATLDDGDPAERAFLASFGYDEILGAGVRADPGTAWLVEIFGDAVSAPLDQHAALLRALVELALTGAEQGTSSHRPIAEVVASSAD